MTIMIEKKLLQRKKQGNLRMLGVAPPLIDFSSNDYLGLSRSPALAARTDREISQHYSQHMRFGSTGSRLLTGNSTYAQELERSIAAFHGYEAGLLFNCGYMANVGLLSTMMDSSSTVFFDAAIHASTRDGIRLSGAQAFGFRHNDHDHLESRLKNSISSRNRWICIESIYSTDGSKAPIVEICRLAKYYGALVIVDEAHATGVCGPNGRGLTAEQGLASEIFAQVTTFGKGVGVHGAIVLGSSALKQALVNFAHSFIYTTALPFHTLAAIKSSYTLFPKMEKERCHLHKLIEIYRKHFPDSSKTPIQSIRIPGNERARGAARQLSLQGFDVRPLLSPTVRQGEEKLRISLHAFNREEELIKLLHFVKIGIFHG